ncbi:MAG TPA: SDR family NAD(P)-dependent oxidoreductase [Polyangiaceae bacterium]|nr:SDR family NAD(P)-dependent oxidoreductase [Polyangiaceae bacterium]
MTRRSRAAHPQLAATQPERHGSAVVTGASSGVGRALALELARDRDTLVLVGRDGERLAAVASEVEDRGARAQIELADLAEPAAVLGLGTRLAQRLPALSALVHAAGEYLGEPFAEVSSEAFSRVLAVNLQAPAALTRALLAPLGAAPGDLVFINSSVVGQRRAGISAYAASKAGLAALADSLRQELNPLGVRVLSVFLGATATPLQERLHTRSGRAYRPEALLAPENVAHTVRAALDLPRRAELTELHLRPATCPKD